jgi:hypothetical protein
MATPQKTYRTVDGQEITCLEDLPKAAGLLARQRFLLKCYTVTAVLAILPNIPYIETHFGRALWPLSLLVLLGLTGPWLYAFLLLSFFRCPVCRNRFALMKTCPACGLPTHRDSSKSLLDPFETNLGLTPPFTAPPSKANKKLS